MLVFELMKRLYDIISQQYSGIWKWIMRILFWLRSWFFDLEYKGIPKDKIEELLDYWKTYILPVLHYEIDVFDCDDYAMEFVAFVKKKLALDHGIKVNGVGIAIGTVCLSDGTCGKHAWNLAIIDNDIKFIEPQLGEILEWDSNEKVFKASDKIKYWLEAVII